MHSMSQVNTTQTAPVESLPLLAETGLMAISYGELEQAEVIFNYLLNIRPGAFVTDLGFALIALHKKQFTTAKCLLQRHSQSEQDGDFAHAFLALICYLNNEIAQSLTFITQVKDSHNQLAAQLALALDGEINTSGEFYHEQ